MKTKLLNEEVFYAKEQTVKVGYQDIKFLKDHAYSNKRKRARLCSHRDLEDQIHEMFIIHTKNSYIRPHKHINKTESFHVIEGSVDVVIYNDDGSIMEIMAMGEYGTERIFFCRLSDPFFHTIRILSDYLVFHETTNGPFEKSNTLFAPWTPEESDKTGVKIFMNRLERSIEAWSAVRPTPTR